MSSELLIRYCAPTLAGIKPGNVFNAFYGSDKELAEFMTSVTSVLLEKGLGIRVLRKRNDRALLYVYRLNQLNDCLNNAEITEFLKEYGYAECKGEECLDLLSCRIQKSEEFPHEIGIFLGYPLVDVKGFIKNNAANYKCSGYWKVYGNVAEAQKKFTQYKECTSAYMDMWSNGVPLKSLIVAE